MLRKVLAAECTPELVRKLKKDDARRAPESLWKALTEIGVLGLPFGERFGGSSGSLEDLAVFFREAGRVLCPTIVYSTFYFGLALDRLGSEVQRERYLNDLCAGRLRACVALWSPHDARDLRPALVARPSEAGYGGFRVSGELTFVSDAHVAEVLLATAGASEPAEPARTFGLLVDTATDGVRIDTIPTMAGKSLCRVAFDDVRVPADAVMPGADGAGLRADDLRHVADTAVALRCMDMVGGADAVLRRTADYTSTRHQFGRPIGSFQAAQHLVADMHVALSAAQLTTRCAVYWLGRGRQAARETAIARMHAAAAYKKITLDAHQLHGGMGYVREADLHLWSERARTFATLDGTADVAAEWLRQEVRLA